MPRGPEKKAFTVGELLIAMSITAVVGLAVATVAGALSRAHAQAESARDAVQSGRAGMARIEAVLRRAKLVTAAPVNQLVCWMGDANQDRQINLDELVMIGYVPDERTVELRRVIFPDTLPADLVNALNVQRKLYECVDPDEIAGLMEEALYDPYRLSVVLADDVEDFRVSVDAPAPFTRLVIVRMTVGALTDQIVLSNAVLLRADAVGNVFMADTDGDGVDDSPVLGDDNG
jgi:Tfp pilus assembly protein FimT